MGFATPWSTASPGCWCRRRTPRLSPARSRVCSRTTQSESRWETRPGNAFEICSIPGSSTAAFCENTSGCSEIATRPARCIKLSPGFRPATVAVFEAHDVILPQIATRLDFDEVERFLSRIFEAMLGADRDIRGFVLREEHDFLAARHFRGARHHHPVLRAILVHLQRQRPAGLHHDALDLKALACVDAFVIPPGPVDPAVRNVLGSSLPVEALDHFLDLLRARFVGP